MQRPVIAARPRVLALLLAFITRRQAFKLAVKLKGMSSEKRTDFLRAIDSHRHILGLDDHGDLFDEVA